MTRDSACRQEIFFHAISHTSKVCTSSFLSAKLLSNKWKKKKIPHTLLLIQNLCKKEYYKLIQANNKHEIYTYGVVMCVWSKVCVELSVVVESSTEIGVEEVVCGMPYSYE